MSHSSLAIANSFLQIAGEQGCEVTPMKLLKLVYIAHGWHLAIEKKPLVTDQIQAWKYGPVIPALYSEIKGHGNSPINKLVTSWDGSIQDFRIPLLNSEPVREFLNAIWNEYKSFTGGQLSTMTHRAGTPWSDAWNDRAPGERGTVIPDELIQKYYTTKLEG